MKRSWYSRMLFSYFPVFLLVVSVLIVLAFIIVTELSRSETQKANYISTSYIVDTVERSLSDVQMSVIQEIESNYFYNDFFDQSGSAYPANSSYEIVQSMNNLAERFSLIDSIYLYRNKDAKILSQSGYVDLEFFHEADFIHHIPKEKDQLAWSPVRMFQPRNSKQPHQVVSLVRRLPIPYGSEGYIVINVNVYRLERMVDSLTNGELSFLRMKDSAGTLVYDSSESTGDKNIRILSTIKAENLGWTFESGLKAGRLFAWISVISYVWFIIGLVTISLGVLYIIYITRRNYRPIHQLMVRIQSLQLRGKNEAPASIESDELTLMHNALDKLVQITTDYERERYENLIIQRRQLFMDITTGERLNDIPERLETLDPFEGKGDFGAYVVFAADMNRLDEFQALSLQDQNLLKFALTNVLSNLMAEKQMQAWSEWISGQRVVTIIGLREQQSTYDAESLLDLAKSCHSWVLENLRISLSLGIGSVVSRWEDIHLSYAAADELLSHRLSLGTDIVADNADQPDDSAMQSYIYFEDFTQLVREFRLSGENWRTRLVELFDSFRKNRLKDNEIYMLLEVMLQLLEREFGGLSETLDRQFARARIADMKEQIRKCTELEEISEILTEWLNETYHVYVSVNELKSHRVMITEVKHYIEENYVNSDLSLNHLSERFRISGKYASYLFKEEFNMKFVDFLAELRVSKAKELLDRTADSIQDIAIQVGYANAITFGRVFKRVTGMTPGDHRKLKLNKDDE
ncbi:helix-turn-helix domain-containing protein [Paenibacillus sp. HW567]|uniref:helix-turn-helix domain-containing protein n=1 Tax=Paenibacillus sp. HW567 TaxID=1034769 RepID=UPI000566967E|nr:helix-turn-helix domain-containing protein [Paenibacillus sp. HW567]